MCVFAGYEGGAITKILSQIAKSSVVSLDRYVGTTTHNQTLRRYSRLPSFGLILLFPFGLGEVGRGWVKLGELRCGVVKWGEARLGEVR